MHDLKSQKMLFLQHDNSYKCCLFNTLKSHLLIINIKSRNQKSKLYSQSFKRHLECFE